MTTVTVQDRLEVTDAADARAAALRTEIAVATAELGYYVRLDANSGGSYISGSYILANGDGEFICRGPTGGVVLARRADGLKTASRFTTQREAEFARDRWHADARVRGDDHEGSDRVFVTSHRDGLFQHLRWLERHLKQAERIVRQSDPYFDASPGAQQAESDHRQ